MNTKPILYAFACLSFSVVIGGAVYEHLTVVPAWSAAIPASLSMFQGTHGLNPAPFWISIHPVTLLLMLGSLAVFWKTEGRRFQLTALAGYVLVLVITQIYFVPELLELTGTPFAVTVDQGLTARGQLWEKLSLVRLAFLVVLAITQFLGLTRIAYALPEAAAAAPACKLQPVA